jgi:hypothetical protein
MSAPNFNAGGICDEPANFESCKYDPRVINSDSDVANLAPCTSAFTSNFKDFELVVISRGQLYAQMGERC